MDALTQAVAEAVGAVERAEAMMGPADQMADAMRAHVAAMAAVLRALALAIEAQD